MRINFEGTMSLAQYGKLVKEVIQDVATKAGIDPKDVKLSNPVMQMSLQIKGYEEPQVLTTPHGELFVIDVKVEKGKIVTESNEDEAKGDKRLLSETDAAKETPLPKESIESEFKEEDIQFIEDLEVRHDLKQRVYSINGSEDTLIRYYGIEDGKERLIFEEVARPNVIPFRKKGDTK
ncbi:hypothetical protein FT641_26990 [Bacillus paranthracis]|uniref:hypothetical protein n=1 Tax=Bacillus paranthracis TaxID=2026186 RepID=UPI000BFE2611|nr:hypothetical protein [Bacillus paranthracis]MBE7117299.1 hypothetical protein [Bacillus paranthracis]MBE7134913.1 hypothetical protein [Bacillus paranthracis]MBE7156322.1 hypothetical protein [Bacillus paranthracis]PGZ29533.1 hypothetical protein COE50_22225 [Bacillus anthracis]